MHIRCDVQIPWAALGRQQVQVEIDRLYLLAVPSYQQDAPPPEDMQHEEERLDALKRAQVHAQEKLWVDGMHAQEHVNDSDSTSYLQGVTNIVLGNLKIKVCANLGDRESWRAVHGHISCCTGNEPAHSLRRHHHTPGASVCNWDYAAQCGRIYC